MQTELVTDIVPIFFYVDDKYWQSLRKTVILLRSYNPSNHIRPDILFVNGELVVER